MNIFKRGKGTDVSNRRREKSAGIAGRFAVETRKTDDSVVLTAAPVADVTRPAGQHEEQARVWDEHIDSFNMPHGYRLNDLVNHVMVNHTDALARRTYEASGEDRTASKTITDDLEQLSETFLEFSLGPADAAEEISKTRARLHEAFRNRDLADGAVLHYEADRELGRMQQYLLDRRWSRRDPDELMQTEEVTQRRRMNEVRRYAADCLRYPDSDELSAGGYLRATAANVFAEDLAFGRHHGKTTGSQLHTLAAATAAELPDRLIAARNTEEALQAVGVARNDLFEAARRTGSGIAFNAFGELHDSLGEVERLIGVEEQVRKELQERQAAAVAAGKRPVPHLYGS